MRNLSVSVWSMVFVFLCVFAISLPLLTAAETLRFRPDDSQERITSRLENLLGLLCDRITETIERGFPISVPAFCAPEPPPPPPPPIDVCPNVPGNQAAGPCADVQCTEAGGTWNGASCDMPPPPPVDVCPNVPGLQESGPCADVECTEDGGAWDGDSCDMPPPPEGSVVLNEIMYDLPGTDGTREWIEVMNGTDETVDLSDWTLFESGTSRALTLIMGNAVLPAGGFAIIAANNESFLTDWPDFEGTLFDTTSFTLVNTGEILVLKNGAGETVDEVTYSPEDGAEGDGSSLQLIDDDWVAAPPTPSAANASSDPT